MQIERENMTRIAVFPKGKQDVYEQYGYSSAIKSGDLLFVSGQVGVRGDGTPIEAPGAQIEKAFANLSEVLEAAGCTMDDIVDITSFHVDMHQHFKIFSAAKQQIFPERPFPNWAAIGVNTLADPALLFEIKVIARIA